MVQASDILIIIIIIIIIIIVIIVIIIIVIIIMIIIIIIIIIALWEKEGSGDISAKWVEEVKSAINSRVAAPTDEQFLLTKEEAVNAIRKKRNWSAPGPDRITNYWWKKAYSLHEGVSSAFMSIVQHDHEYPLWFAEGKTSLIPKAGEFSSEDQRPITCLNNMYKWFTSCMLKPMNQHLDKYALIEGEQRGAKVGCSGTIDNLLIDRMVCEDSKIKKRNLSMAWIDVKKAYDSVDHKWLVEMMAVHWFPDWVGKMVSRLCATWNTHIVVTTKQGRETSDLIKFNKGLPQGDALCPRLFTICLNPVALQLKASEGYKLSKPISAKITDLLYIDDLKVFAVSATKMTRVLKATKESTKCIGMQWNEKKCAVTHMKKGALDQTTSDMKLDESAVIARLKDGEQYKFLGVQENLRQEDKLVLNCAAEIYLKRVSVIWSSSLSDHNRITATNQFALPVLAYLMRTQK